MLPAVLAGAAGMGLFSRLLSGALHPLDASIAANYAPDDYLKRLASWHDQRCLIPGVDVLFDLFIRQMIGPGLAGNTLGRHGVELRIDRAKDGAKNRSHIWHQAAKLKQVVPDPGWILDGWQRGLILEDTARKLMTRAGGDFDRLKQVAHVHLVRPGPELAVQAWAEGRLEWVDAVPLIKLWKGSVDSWKTAREWMLDFPGLSDAVQMFRRTGLTDAQFQQILQSKRIPLDPWLPHYQELRKEIPGASDLLRMASRQLFSPEIVGAYGLYSEFPEAMRPWFAKLGLDYQVGFNLPAQDGGRPATLPDLYWGITREILPLNAAYMAYQRLRPGAIARFQREVPDLKPFTLQDLRYHMQVAGYPPPMRDYLIALSHPPIGRRQITMAVQYGGWDLQRTKDALLDLGDTEDNALLQAEVLLARKDHQDNAWKDSVERRAHTQTVSEIEGMYDEGIIDRGQALSHLGAAGLSAQLSAQLLDLADAKRARGLLRAATSATGRDYLSGALSAGEAAAALAALGIKPARAGELMQIWTVRRSRHRRQASTAQIIRWVGLGRLPFAEGSRRLANLGWSDPDQILLLADAQATIDKALAREYKLADQADVKRAHELERIAREHQAEHRRLISEANRVAPRSVLMKWLRSGEISQDDFRAALRARDFPEVDIDRYVEDALRPHPGKTRKVPVSGIYPRAPGSRHPALGMAEKWYLTEVISLDQFRQTLEDMGYGPDDRERIIAAADLKHGSKGTTREPPAPAPPP